MLLDIRKLSVRFPVHGSEVHAVNGATLQVHEGEVHAVVGESGSGKSQCFLSLARLVPEQARISGEAWYNGRNLVELPAKELARLRGREIAYVFQDPMTALNPYMRIGSQLREVARLHAKGRQVDIEEALMQMLRAVRLPDPAQQLRRYPHQLSGGQQQRVMLAMALLAQPRLLIADEPTTALDVTVQRQVLDLLRQLQQEFGFSLVIITHDLGVVARLAQRVSVMYAGRIMETASAETFFATPRHPYSKALLAAAPRLKGGLPQPIPGQPPKPTHVTPGCPFAARCPVVMNTCQKPLPWVELEKGHYLACHLEARDDGTA